MLGQRLRPIVEGRGAELGKAAESERQNYYDALARGEVDNTGVLLGEAAGLVHSVQPDAALIEQIVKEAIDSIGTQSRTVM